MLFVIKDDISKRSVVLKGYTSAVIPSTLVIALIASTYPYSRASPVTPTDLTGNNTQKACHIL